MDVKRASVLVIGFTIVLAFLASFMGTIIQVPPTNSTNPWSISFLGSYSISKPKYIYNKTIILSPNINDLQYIKGGYSDYSPPYYFIPNTNIPVIFNLSTPKDNLLNLLLNALSWNASRISPEAYGALLSIANSAYVNVTNYSETILQPMPVNEYDPENYSKWELIVKYAKALEAPDGFQPGWSYPPSVSISLGSLTYGIDNETSVQTDVYVSNYSSLYLDHEENYTDGNTTYVYKYYDMDVYGVAYLLDSNGNVVGSKSFYYTFYWWGGSETDDVYGYVTVPPGVEEQVYGSYTIATDPGYVENSTKNGNKTIVYYIYYPKGPKITTQGYTFNWYKYYVIFPLNITVFNGTNPTTYINNKQYNDNSIYTIILYTTWSSSPQDYPIKIMTRDVIHIANYTVVRTWDAGSAVIKPKVVVKQNGNVINYLLDFSTQNNFVKPPSWLNHSMTYNKYASITWFYLEQNASLAHALHEYIMKTINSNDKQYWKFEYFVLASEFVMYTFNTTYSVYNNMLELESFYVNWSTLPSKILNLSVWPNRTYSLGVLMFFNVSRIPQIYNVTNYFNITGNYEVYLTDIYNGLDYNKWDRVPFGNTYYFYNPIINETVYFYLNDSNLPVPYLHEDLYFESTNYVTDVYYITFQYSAPLKEEITAIWNGTTWET